MSNETQALKKAGGGVSSAAKAAAALALKKKRNKKIFSLVGGISTLLIVILLFLGVIVVVGIFMMFQVQSAVAGHYQDMKGNIEKVQSEWSDAVIAEMKEQDMNVEYADLVLCIIAAASGGGSAAGGEGGDIMMSSVYEENPTDTYPREELSITDPLYSIKIGVTRFKTMLNKAFDDAVPELSSTFTDQGAYNKLWVCTAGYWYVGYIDKYTLWTKENEKEFSDILPAESLYKRENFVTDVQNLFMILHPETSEQTKILFPFIDGEFYINSNYGNRDNPTDPGTTEFHSGIDIKAPEGTAVFAAENGTVHIPAFRSEGYGNHIRIDHGGGFVTLYGHLSSIAVTEGQTVTKGDVIGYVGSTGRSTGAHLHFETIYDGKPRNPIEYILWGRAAN